MIVETILNVIELLVVGILSLFPSIPPIDTSNLDGFIRVVSLTDMFINLRVLSACLVVMFVFANIQFIWSVIMWCIRKIPGIK